MQSIEKIYIKVLNLGLYLSILMLIFATLAVSTDVFLRNLGWGGLPWVVEVSEYILFLSTFLAAPWVMHKEGHTRMDALIKLFPKKIGEIFRDVGNLFVMLVCLFMLVYGAQAAWEAFSLNAIIYKQLEIPEWWLLSIVPFCGFLLVSEFIFRFMHKLGWGDAATKQRRE